MTVRQATDNSLHEKGQYVINKALALNNSSFLCDEGDTINTTNIYSLQETFNIQLFYDINQATKHDSWDGNTYPISLYSVIEHLTLNTDNIKASLLYIVKYIKNKQVNQKNVNNIKTFDGIGKAA